MIGLEDIAGIKSAEEGKAVALAIYNQLPRWIEITDDPATWPPLRTIVLAKTSECGAEFVYLEGADMNDKAEELEFFTPHNMILGYSPGLDFECGSSYRGSPVKQWRQIL